MALAKAAAVEVSSYGCRMPQGYRQPKRRTNRDWAVCYDMPVGKDITVLEH